MPKVQPFSSQARVDRVLRLSPSVLKIRVERTDALAWSPGQYVVLRKRIEDSEVAYFSIASAPLPRPSRDFELAVAENSNFFTEEILSGTPFFVDEAQGDAPYERLADAQVVVLIGMGTGVAPLRAIAQALTAERSELAKSRAIIFLQGCRSNGDCLFYDELLAMYPSLDYRPVYSQAEANFPGRSGRVQEHLKDLPIEGAEYCVCGSGEMVMQVSELLKARGLPAERLFGEGS